MFALMQEWEASTESSKVFYEKHNIKEHIFYYWRKKYLKSKNTTSEGFVPVSISEEKESLVPMIEIAYPNGTVVRLGKETSISTIRSLINLL